jgi:hypothetical protein
MERLDKMLLRYIDIPKEIYYKMIEYLGTDEPAEVNEFILDVLESYIEIHSTLEDIASEGEEYE